MPTDARKLLLPIVIVVAQAAAFADGSTVQLRKETGDLVVTLFTSPARPTAGHVDLSVLLQDRNSLKPVLDGDVSLLLREQASGAQVQVRASREPAGNELVYAAPVSLQAAGKWQVTVVVERRGTRCDAAGVIDVGPDRTMVASYWGYVAFPPVMIVAFVMQGWFVRREE